MRLCVKSEDNTSHAIEIIYAAYDFISKTDDDWRVRLKMLDSDHDEWYVDNISQTSADEIIYHLVRDGYAILDEGIYLKYISFDSADNSGTTGGQYEDTTRLRN